MDWVIMKGQPLGMREGGSWVTKQTQQEEEEVVGVWDYSTCLLGLIPGEPELWGRKFETRGSSGRQSMGPERRDHTRRNPRTGAEVLGEYTSSCSHTPCCFNTRTHVKYNCPDFTG